MKRERLPFVRLALLSLVAFGFSVESGNEAHAQAHTVQGILTAGTSPISSG